MQPEFDSASSTSGTTASSLTWAHTVANKQNRILVVGVSSEDATAGDVDVSGITYNGVALTKAKDQTWAGQSEEGSKTNNVEMWYLLDPPIGTYNIIATFGGSCDALSGGGISLYNMKQSTPEVTASNTRLTIGEISTNITTLTNNAIIIDVVGNQDAGTTTPGGSQTERYDVTSGGAGHMTACSTKIQATAGATSMSQTPQGKSSGHVLGAWAYRGSFAGGMI